MQVIDEADSGEEGLRLTAYYLPLVTKCSRVPLLFLWPVADLLQISPRRFHELRKHLGSRSCDWNIDVEIEVSGGCNCREKGRKKDQTSPSGRIQMNVFRVNEIVTFLVKYVPPVYPELWIYP
jgi:hypothetical protein